MYLDEPIITKQKLCIYCAHWVFLTVGKTFFWMPDKNGDCLMFRLPNITKPHQSESDICTIHQTGTRWHFAKLQGHVPFWGIENWSSVQ